MQDIGATLDAVKAAQARAENIDAVFAQLWRERTAWAKDCLEAHGINDEIAARDAALAARFADIDTDDKDPLAQLLARDASLAGNSSSSQIELLSSNDQNVEIKRDCERLESALQRFFFATKPSHRSSTLRLQIIDVLERCEELLASPNLRAVRNLRQGLADLESVVPRRHIAPWRALQEATSLVVSLARKVCVASTTSALAARSLRAKKLQQKNQVEQDWKAKIGVKRRKSAAGLSSRTSAGSLAPEGLGVLRLVLYLHDRGCVARDLLRATESAQAQVEYAAAECASTDLARLVARFGTVELEHRRRHLLARWMAAEALSGELIASSRLTHHVEAYISALEQKHSFVRGASHSLASRWPELSESVYEPLYHEIDRPFSSSSEIVAPIALGQDAHNDLLIADFIKLLLQEDDSEMCNNVQIPALCALSLETSHSPKSSSSLKTSHHAAGAARGENSGQRPPWNPSVLVHDPIRTRGGAEPIGKRQLAHLFSSNSPMAVRTEKGNVQRAMYAVSTSARSPMATHTSDAKATLSPSLVKARINAVLLAN